MEIREFTEGDVLVLAPDGRVAGSEDTNALENRLGSALKTGVRRVVLDCAAVGQLSSGAIRVLLMTSQKLDRLKGRLVLCELSEKVKKAFSISRLDKDFTIVASRAEASQRVLDPVKTGPVRIAKSTPPKAVPSARSPAPSQLDDQQAPLPALPATSVAVDRTLAVQAVARAPVVDSGPPPPSVPDRREALANALLDALGVPGHRPDAARGSRPTAANLAALASGMLAALRVGRL